MKKCWILKICGGEYDGNYENIAGVYLDESKAKAEKEAFQLTQKRKRKNIEDAELEEHEIID